MKIQPLANHKSGARLSPRVSAGPDIAGSPTAESDVGEFDDSAELTSAVGGVPTKAVYPGSYFETANLVYHGAGKDVNGNHVVRVSLPNDRAFSIQTLQNLPASHALGKADPLTPEMEAEIVAYIQAHGSQNLKSRLNVFASGAQPHVSAISEEEFMAIKPGDYVTIATPQGQSRGGRVVMANQNVNGVVVINGGGAHGTPLTGTPRNIVSVKVGKGTANPLRPWLGLSAEEQAVAGQFGASTESDKNSGNEDKQEELDDAAKMESAAMTNEEFIEHFLKAPLSGLKTGQRVNNLMAKKEEGGWVLINYLTPLVFRAEDGKAYFNTQKYSTTTSKIQSIIRRYSHPEWLTEVDEKKMTKIMDEAMDKAAGGSTPDAEASTSASKHRSTDPRYIKTVADLDRVLADGPYADGGYPKYFLTEDGGALAFSTVKAEYPLIKEAIESRDKTGGWFVIAFDINWENPELYDDHTGERIKSAYAEDQAEGSEAPAGVQPAVSAEGDEAEEEVIEDEPMETDEGEAEEVPEEEEVPDPDETRQEMVESDAEKRARSLEYLKAAVEGVVNTISSLDTSVSLYNDLEVNGQTPEDRAAAEGMKDLIATDLSSVIDRLKAVQVAAEAVADALDAKLVDRGVDVEDLEGSGFHAESTALLSSASLQTLSSKFMSSMKAQGDFSTLTDGELKGEWGSLDLGLLQGEIAEGVAPKLMACADEMRSRGLLSSEAFVSSIRTYQKLTSRPMSFEIFEDEKGEVATHPPKNDQEGFADKGKTVPLAVELKKHPELAKILKGEGLDSEKKILEADKVAVRFDDDNPEKVEAFKKGLPNPDKKTAE